MKLIPDSVRLRVCSLNELEETIYSGLDECHSTFRSTSVKNVDWEYINLVLKNIKTNLGVYRGRFSNYFDSSLRKIEEEIKGVLGYENSVD
ncbi:MAG: hypothetical protein KKC19_01815 [Nanoarchaeota archaeon]|nr:hypothetical protein [Nanoarchaeota archaeon]